MTIGIAHLPAELLSFIARFLLDDRDKAHLKLAAKLFLQSSRAFPSHWHQRVECTSKQGARSLALFLQRNSGLRLEEGLGCTAARLLAEVMGGDRPAYNLVWPAYQEVRQLDMRVHTFAQRTALPLLAELAVLRQLRLDIVTVPRTQLALPVGLTNLELTWQVVHTQGHRSKRGAAAAQEELPDLQQVLSGLSRLCRLHVHASDLDMPDLSQLAELWELHLCVVMPAQWDARLPPGLTSLQLRGHPGRLPDGLRQHSTLQSLKLAADIPSGFGNLPRSLTHLWLRGTAVPSAVCHLANLAKFEMWDEGPVHQGTFGHLPAGLTSLSLQACTPGAAAELPHHVQRLAASGLRRLELLQGWPDRGLGRLLHALGQGRRIPAGLTVRVHEEPGNDGRPSFADWVLGGGAVADG